MSLGSLKTILYFSLLTLADTPAKIDTQQFTTNILTFTAMEGS